MPSAACATSHPSWEPSSPTPGSGSSSELAWAGTPLMWVWVCSHGGRCETRGAAWIPPTTCRLECVRSAWLQHWVTVCSQQDHHLPVCCLRHRPCGQISGSHSHCGQQGVPHVSYSLQLFPLALNLLEHSRCVHQLVLGSNFIQSIAKKKSIRLSETF